MVRWLLISVIALIVYLLRGKGVLRIAPNQAKAESEIRDTLKGTKWEPMSDVIVAQAKHESGNFTSKLYKNNLNPFGMNRPYTRPTTDNRNSDLKVEGSVMANYNSVADSTRDLMYYLEQWKSEPFIPEVHSDPKKYATLLKRHGYYTDKYDNYKNALIQWINS